MNISESLINNISKNLKIDTFSFEEDKKYNVNLSEFISVLYEISEKENVFPEIISIKKKVKFNSLSSCLTQYQNDFVVMYIITITFSQSNTMIHVSDSTGNIKWSCSSGSVNIKGKRKKQRRPIISKLILLMFKHAKFLFNKPVALHLNRVNSYQTFIVDKLKTDFYIKIIKSFNQIPYNGCRKKKIRRKKYIKTFK